MVKANIIISWIAIVLIVLVVLPTSVHIGGEGGVLLGAIGTAWFIVSILNIVGIMGPKDDEPENSKPV